MEEYPPALQLSHTMELLAALTGEKVPAGHPRHKLEPAASEYVPGLQLTQTAELLHPLSDAYRPTGQRMHMDVLFAASTVENVPAGQLVHELEPRISE